MREEAGGILRGHQCTDLMMHLTTAIILSISQFFVLATIVRRLSLSWSSVTGIINGSRCRCCFRLTKPQPCESERTAQH
eukprot:COSAG06_NODE_14474_length_1153_cov_1.615750_1_plen_79_part_00